MGPCCTPAGWLRTAWKWMPMSGRSSATWKSHGILDPEDSRQLPGFVSLLFGGYFYQNQLFITRMCQQFIVPVVEAANQRIYPSRAVANEAAMIKAIASGFRPYHLFTRMLLFGSTRSEE